MVRRFVAFGLAATLMAGGLQFVRQRITADLNGQPVFELASGFGGLSASRRADIIHHRLQWLSLEGVNPATVQAKEIHGLWYVAVGEQVVATADPVTARADHTTPHDLAIYWSYVLREALRLDQAAIAIGHSTIMGLASWYGPGFVGLPTASGQPYNPQDLTCASPWLPLGTVLRITDLQSGRAVTVVVNDRGPYVAGRILDLSEAAAEAIGLVGPGVAYVRAQVLS